MYNSNSNLFKTEPLMLTTVTTQKRAGCSGSIASSFIPTLNRFVECGNREVSSNILEGAIFERVASRYFAQENPVFVLGSCHGRLITFLEITFFCDKLASALLL